MHRGYRIVVEPLQHAARIKQEFARRHMKTRTAGQRKKNVAKDHIE